MWGMLFEDAVAYLSVGSIWCGKTVCNQVYSPALPKESGCLRVFILQQPPMSRLPSMSYTALQPQAEPTVSITHTRWYWSPYKMRFGIYGSCQPDSLQRFRWHLELIALVIKHSSGTRVKLGKTPSLRIWSIYSKKSSSRSSVCEHKRQWYIDDIYFYICLFVEPMACNKICSIFSKQTTFRDAIFYLPRPPKLKEWECQDGHVC